MSNLNQFKKNLLRLISNKLLKNHQILFKKVIFERSYELLSIDNKISLLPVWRYISKPFC